jgi:hypothetical protein
VFHDSASCDPKSKSRVTHFQNSLGSEIDILFQARIKDVMHPLREELSTIKLWLARMAKCLECTGSDGKLMSTSNMVELFGPCSPIEHSPTPMIFASLVEVCAHVESLVCEDLSNSITDEIIPTTHSMESPDVENHGKMKSAIDDMHVDQTFEVSTGTCISQGISNPSEDQKSFQYVDPVGNVVQVENFSEDEPISNAFVADENEDPILLITDEDDPTQPTAKFKVENAHLCDGLGGRITTTEVENLPFSPPPTKAIKC